MIFRSLVAIAAMIPALGLAQSLGMESDWLELVKGHRDVKSGAQVMDVKKDPVTGNQTAMIKVPKAVLLSETDMEEVKVVARAPEKREMPDLLPELESEWVDDYDNDHYGLLIKLNSDQKIPFRLFFSSYGQGGSIDGGVQP
ncbi:hypothetical protein [Congregibacter litoralis]|uniref:Uncharacterized protein n=1 Tax=Congregibacter litoralis KT71 TaxID=314285 RepID=A4AB08_9GAMM|nr:hypothetical protein [Congregibacter litoralis]EAQ96880.1 hypothetical protein KT71_11284 [Congregibacter litoralis KT71]